MAFIPAQNYEVRRINKNWRKMERIGNKNGAEILRKSTG